MDRQQLPAMAAEPEIAARIPETRSPGRSNGHGARHRNGEAGA